LQLAAEFGTGQVLWSILWFFLFFVWIMLIFQIFGDIIRSDDMGGGAKAIWSIFIIFLPFLGIFIYLIVRGGKMGERQMKAAQAQEAAMQDYIRTTAGTGASAADELAKLADLHSQGKLDDAEYAAAKAKIVG
jgi:type VI protein secretion system component VasK